MASSTSSLVQQIILVVKLPSIKNELNLDYDFCCDTCPQAEQIVRSMVLYLYKKHSKIPPAFLRLLVYDCFIQQLMASDETARWVQTYSSDGPLFQRDFAQVMIKLSSLRVLTSPLGQVRLNCSMVSSEKSVHYLYEKQSEIAPALLLSVFNDRFIQIEEVCPATVSCADILVLAATEGIAMAGGPYYHLYTGRRDSLMSFPEVGAYELPSPCDDLYKTLTSFASRGFDERETVSILGARGSPYDDLYKTLTSFASRGFDERETVSILGAHSIGIIYCQFFHNRLYNFAGSGGPDPSLEPVFLNQMRSRCSFLLLYCSMVSSEGL